MLNFFKKNQNKDKFYKSIQIAAKIADNANELVQTIVKLKPTAAKGVYIKSITMSSTMGAGVKVDLKSI